MRAALVLTSTFLIVTVAFALPSCSSDPAASAPADDGGRPGEGGQADAEPPGSDAAPDGPVASVEYRAGSRLRPIVTTGGGAKIFNRMHDTLLDVDCTYVTLSDEQRHCAPDPKPGGTVYFTDAACTQKIVGWVASCAPATPVKYASYVDASIGCGARPEILELGVASAPATTYAKNGAACDVYAGSALAYRSVTRAVPPSELVPATVTREARGAQLFATYLDGADGSRQPFEIESGGAHAGACFESRMADGVTRCTPASLAYLGGQFTDATCTKPAALQAGYMLETCKLPPVAVESDHYDTCTDQYSPSLFDVGPKVAGASYQGSPASCTTSPSPGQGSTFWAQGAAIPDTDFAVVKHVRGTTTPLTVDSLAAATGETLHAASLFDPAHAFACAGWQTSDHKTRCVERQRADVTTYADAACSQPLAIVYHASPGCGPRAVPSYASLSVAGIGCEPAVLHLWSVGAKVSPAQVYTTSGGCTAQAPDPGVDYYATSPEIAPSALVELTEVME
jgi:hypothetical protein